MFIVIGDNYAVDELYFDPKSREARRCRREASARGYARAQVKSVFGLRVAWAAYSVFEDPLEGSGLRLEAPNNAQLFQVFVRTLKGTQDRLLARDGCDDPRGVFAEFRQAGVRRGLSKVLCSGGTAAGVMLPVLDRTHRDVGFVNYVGLIPRYRGRGLGDLLTRSSIRLLALHGARIIMAVADLRNRPIRRIVTRLGFEEVARQEVWSKRRRLDQEAGSEV